MELNCIQIVLLKYCRVRMHVCTSRSRCVDHGRIVAVREIREWLLVESFEEARRSSALERVPAHVWNASRPRETSDDAREDTEPSFTWRFFTCLKQALQADADPKE